MHKVKNELKRSQRSINNTRSGGGQAVVEGVCILALLTAVSVGLIALIADIGMTLDYQQKTTFLASQAAMYAAGKGNGWNYQNTGNFAPDVNSVVKELAQEMGLPSNRVSATFDKRSETVTVNAEQLPLIAGFNFLPGVISVHQTFATSSSILPRPTGLLSLTVRNQTAPLLRGGTNPTVLIPCYSGLAQKDLVGSRSEGDSQDPRIPGPGMYDQFSYSVPASSGAAMTYTPGTRGMKP